MFPPHLKSLDQSRIQIPWEVGRIIPGSSWLQGIQGPEVHTSLSCAQELFSYPHQKARAERGPAHSGLATSASPASTNPHKPPCDAGAQKISQGFSEVFVYLLLTVLFYFIWPFKMYLVLFCFFFFWVLLFSFIFLFISFGYSSISSFYLAVFVSMAKWLLLKLKEWSHVGDPYADYVCFVTFASWLDLWGIC